MGAIFSRRYGCLSEIFPAGSHVGRTINPRRLDRWNLFGCRDHCFAGVRVEQTCSRCTITRLCAGAESVFYYCDPGPAAADSLQPGPAALAAVDTDPGLGTTATLGSRGIRAVSGLAVPRIGRITLVSAARVPTPHRLVAIGTASP